MTWRKCPFVEGAKYCVKQDFTLLAFNFLKGDILLFIRQAYSRYDSSTVFFFQNQRTNEEMQWWLHDEEPIESWSDFFEKQ